MVYMEKTKSAARINNPWFLYYINDFYIYSTIKDGRPGTKMPSFEKVLSKSEMRNITTFLTAQRPKKNLFWRN